MEARAIGGSRPLEGPHGNAKLTGVADVEAGAHN